MSVAARWTMSLVSITLLSGCAGSSYDPGVSAADFVDSIDNPFFPMRPGKHWSYEDRSSGSLERVEVTVLSETRTIQGVKATVVRDRVTVDGELKEDTWDWFAQDREGNVWYLGEDTAEYEGGKVVSREGAWEWGKDGALPGIIMKAAPVADNEAYHQEFYEGEAEDMAAVKTLGEKIVTPAGTFTDTVTIREWTPLEPGIEENAYYARGVGPIGKMVTKGEGTGSKEQLVSYG